MHYYMSFPFRELGFFLSALRRSPADKCTNLNFSCISSHCVPFPAPGPPKIKMTNGFIRNVDINLIIQIQITQSYQIVLDSLLTLILKVLFLLFLINVNQSKSVELKLAKTGIKKCYQDFCQCMSLQRHLQHFWGFNTCQLLIQLYIILILEMPTQLIVNMEQKYPFGTCDICQNTNTKVMMRKTVNTGNKTSNLAKAKFIKNLNLVNVIKIESIFQQKDNLSILYEYVPLKYQTWMGNINQDLIKTIRKDLYLLANQLAQNYININFSLDCIGFSSNYQAKYFIDLDFQIMSKQQQFALKQKYYREIMIILKQNSLSDQSPLRKQLYLSLKESSYIKGPFFNVQQKKKLLKTPSLGSLTYKPQKQGTSQNLITDYSQIKKNHSKQSAPKLNLTIEQYKHNHRLKTEESSDAQSKRQQRSKNVSINQTNHFINPFQYFNNHQKIQIKKKSIQTKPIIFYQRCISIDEIDKKQSTSKTPQKYRNTMEELGSSLVIKRQINMSKTLKSQECTRTQKNSQSPVEYLQIIKSNEEYINDFLDVLEDQEIEEENLMAIDSQEEESQKYNTQNKRQQTQKTSQSQESSPIDRPSNLKWKYRVSNIIQNSKKLIQKLKSLKKDTVVGLIPQSQKL